MAGGRGSSGLRQEEGVENRRTAERQETEECSGVEICSVGGGSISRTVEAYVEALLQGVALRCRRMGVWREAGTCRLAKLQLARGCAGRRRVNRPAAGAAHVGESRSLAPGYVGLFVRRSRRVGQFNRSCQSVLCLSGFRRQEPSSAARIGQAGLTAPRICVRVYGLRRGMRYVQGPGRYR